MLSIYHRERSVVTCNCKGKDGIAIVKDFLNPNDASIRFIRRIVWGFVFIHLLVQKA